MKKIVLLFLFAIGLSFVTLAQFNGTHLINTGAKITKPFPITGVSSKSTTDTLWPTPLNPNNPSTVCGSLDSATAYMLTGSGYLTGNNTYGFTEIGTRVNHTGTGSVTSVMGIMEALNCSSTTDAVSAKIYSSSANKPGTLLGTSTSITLASFPIDTAVFVPFTFTTPVAISGDFFVTIALPSVAGDTLIIFSSTETCTPSPDSLSMFFYMGTCYYYNSMVGYNGDVWIAPIVNEGPAGIATNNAIENLNVYSSDNKIVVKNYSNSVIKQVMIYNILGQEVGNYAVNNSGTVTLDANLPAANYIVKVITDSKVVTYKLYVNR